MLNDIEYLKDEARNYYSMGWDTEANRLMEIANRLEELVAKILAFTQMEPNDAR